MDSTPAFAQLDRDDSMLAGEIAEKLGMELPDECTSGVALNARLLQHHVDTLRGASA